MPEIQDRIPLSDEINWLLASDFAVQAHLSHAAATRTPTSCRRAQQSLPFARSHTCVLLLATVPADV
eukprot:1743982-Rhodomonas_salina.1